MDEFLREWRFRFDAVAHHGMKQRIAAACGVDPTTVSHWGVPYAREDGRVAKVIPDAHQQTLIAETCGVSPAWLAFGTGPRDPAQAAFVSALGELIDRTPGVREWAYSFFATTPEQRQALIALAPQPGIFPPGTVISRPEPGVRVLTPPGGSADKPPGKAAQAGESPGKYRPRRKRT